jgi:hypothetical protein
VEFQIDLVDEDAASDGVEDEIFLTEGEEEDDIFSEDDVPSEQSSLDSLDDGADSEYLSEEKFEDSNNEVSSKESSEMKEMNPDLSLNECFGELRVPDAIGCPLTQQMPSCHVKTSAVTGVGLQELLALIDRKLTEQQNVVQRSYGPFDRKWRPSSLDGEKAAEQ